MVDTSSRVDGCGCKVGTTIATYDLGDANDDLVSGYLGVDGERLGLRRLRHRFNRRVLRAALERAGVDVLPGEVANTYRVLTGADGDDADRVRTRRRLEREGVDVEAVREDFVSHPTIGSHLADCLDVERPDETADPVEKSETRIFKMRSRTEAVVEDAIGHLRNTGAVSDTDVRAFVDVRVSCEECGRQHEVGEFVRRGGCPCGER